MTAMEIGWPEMLVTDHDKDMLGFGGHAVFNEARTHRYLLTRELGTGPPAVFVMLNPSTADAFRNDLTITRCVSFARREGCGSLRVVNLFALRATDPRELRKHPGPVGPSNDRFIDMQADAALIIAAWGAHAFASERAAEVSARLTAAGASLYCLGITAAGCPKHPLARGRERVPDDAPLVPWEAA